MRKYTFFTICILIAVLFAGCESGGGGVSLPGKSGADRIEGSGQRNNTATVLTPEVGTQKIFESGVATIDVSNATEGYFAVSYKGTNPKVRMLVDTPLQNQYNYVLKNEGDFGFYPFSEGSGLYTIGIYENIEADRYALATSQTVEVQIADENKPFLYPNEYVDFREGDEIVKIGADTVAKADDDIGAVSLVYYFVTENIDYDYDKAETVETGYLPVIDDTLQSKKGICFDYASLMAAMLRSQNIPTKLEIGYAGEQYHAWISVYIKDQGWIDDIIVFDGKTWTLMDPTLGSYAKSSTIKDHMQKKDSYYQVKYKY